MASSRLSNSFSIRSFLLQKSTIILAGVCGVLLAVYIAVILAAAEDPLGTDYLKFYESTQLWLNGQNIYTPISVAKYFYLADIATFSSPFLHANLNPPFFSLLLLPLGLLQFGFSFKIWSVLALGASIFVAWQIPKNLGFTSTLASFLAVVLLLAYYPTFITAILGQTTLLLLFLVYLLWKLARNNQDLAAGIVLGIAISIKLYMGIFFLLFLFHRRWRLLLECMGVFGVAQAISVLFFGLDTFRFYLGELSSISWFGANWNASFLGLTTRIFGDALASPLIDLPFLTTPFYYLLSGMAILIWGWLTMQAMTKSRGQKQAAFDLSFSLAVVIMCLAAPLGWIYYFVLLILPAFVIWQSAQGGGLAYNRIMLALAWMLSTIPSLLLQSNELKPIHILFPSGLYSISLIIFFFLLVDLLYRLPKETEGISLSKGD